jgi:ACS family hexuronate transporter-like MFS transporter
LKPTLVKLFHWSDQDFAHLGSALSLATAGAILFSGWFVDRVGVLRSYGLAVVLWSIAGMAVWSKNPIALKTRGDSPLPG